MTVSIENPKMALASILFRLSSKERLLKYILLNISEVATSTNDFAISLFIIFYQEKTNKIDHFGRKILKN